MKKLPFFWKAVIGLCVVFILFRLPGLSAIYQQDEYKWARIVDPKYGIQWTIPHPPFSEFIYQQWGKFVNYDSLRVPPLIFAVLSFILGLWLVRRWYSARSAYAFGLVTIVMAASIFASTQVDIDGAYLPFWTFLTFVGYEEFRGGRKRRGLTLLALGIIGGCFTKLSFLLVPPTIFLDYFWERGMRLVKRWHVIAAIAVTVVALLVWNSPLLNGILIVRYAKEYSFLNIFSRDYLEILFLTLKTVVLIGPVLLLAAYAAIKNPKRYRLLLIFSTLQFLFYYVLFDFSGRTLERYLLVFVFPVAVLAGDLLAVASHGIRRQLNWRTLWPPALFAAGFALVVFLPKVTLPLHPKEQFLSQVAHLKLSFLIPITGGSGPIGFFAPADVAFYSFLVMLVLVWWYAKKKRVIEQSVPLLATIILLFSLFTGAEFLTGWMYGNASTLAKRTLAYACNDPQITQVITYNDIGGWELSECNKYFKRFYLNPKFSEVNETKFGTYKGFYVVVEMPPIGAEQKIMQYLNTCKTVYQSQEKRITGRVFDCRESAYPADEPGS